MPSRTPPAMHLDIPLQTRVRVPADFLGREVSGVVGGIASIHVLYTYIVILDEPHVYDGETHTAITVPGTQLLDESGNRAWLLTPEARVRDDLKELGERAQAEVDKVLKASNIILG